MPLASVGGDPLYVSSEVPSSRGRSGRVIPEEACRVPPTGWETAKDPFSKRLFDGDVDVDGTVVVVASRSGAVSLRVDAGKFLDRGRVAALQAVRRELNAVVRRLFVEASKIVLARCERDV